MGTSTGFTVTCRPASTRAGAAGASVTVGSLAARATRSPTGRAFLFPPEAMVGSNASPKVACRAAM
jgi:hypothetical protein